VQHAFPYYLARLAEGETNPSLAAQSAKVLAVMAKEGDLPALLDAYRTAAP